MIRSIWRLSHLTLALVASLFLILASISGIFLALEPIRDNRSAEFDSSWNNVSIAQAVDSLRANYLEVFSIEKDQNGFYTASVMNDDGDSENFMFNPQSGKKVGALTTQSKFYEWMTAFHRSLFLDTLGRFFVGLTAVILGFIAISGIALVIQRSNSIKSLFDKVEKTLNVQFYHIVFGRLAFIPILIISLTGGYLFLQRFEVIKQVETQPIIVDFDQPAKNYGTFDFTKHTLAEIQKIEFPFSPDEEDYFIIHTYEKEIAVDQYAYNILDQIEIPKTKQYADLSLVLHTGRTNSIWAFVLGIACISILYFIYSGIKMIVLKFKAKTRNKFKLNESNILILTGSEGGNTAQQAKLLYRQLIEAGQKPYICELNKYRAATSIQHLIIFTSTYGTGEAPTTANRFFSEWKKAPLNQKFTFSVVGFGSLAYPEFCKYAEDVQRMLESSNVGECTIPLVKIHNQSYHSVKTWAQDWAKATGIQFTLPPSIQTKQLPKESFKVVDRQLVNNGEHDTYILTLQANNRKIKSGDLLAIYPPQDPFERLYSIGKIDEHQLKISIRRHEKGIASNYLNELAIGTTFEAGIKKNSEFHLTPNKAAIFIGNGTGMGPFLGMMKEAKKESYLFWGGRNHTSYSLYETFVEDQITKGYLTKKHIAYSREFEVEKTYVGDLVAKEGKQISALLKSGAVIYICGSLAMQQDVLAILNKITESNLGKPLSYYQKKKQLRMDCY